MHTHIPVWTLWLFVPLFAIRVGFRLWRFLAYQRLVVSRELWSSGLLVIGLCALAVAAADVHASVMALAGGVLTGIFVGVWGASRTRVDQQADGLHFRPSPYVGSALSALLLGRIAWRLIAGSVNADGWTAAELLHNASTLYLFGLFATNYLAFSAGLIRASVRSRRIDHPFIPIVSAFLQRADEAAIRKPGARLLGEFAPVRREAAKHWESALLSVAAYGRTRAGLRHRRQNQHIDADGELARAGWARWTDFPGESLHRKIAVSGLRVEVWQKPAANIVTVAFGGTVFTSGKDWRSNLRWFLPKHRDEYSDIVQFFAEAFVEAYREHRQSDPTLQAEDAVLHATGHSLGGGLAQQFAYALPLSNATPRVGVVHAFDPSPVTGFFSVPKALRDHNKQHLATDRAYERGEVLSIFRSLLSVFVRPSKLCPTIRGVRYYVFSAFDPITGHSMEKLAAGLQSASGHGQTTIVAPQASAN